MPLARSFQETVADCARRDPAFVTALIEEAKRALAEGDMEASMTAVHYSYGRTRTLCLDTTE